MMLSPSTRFLLFDAFLMLSHNVNKSSNNLPPLMQLPTLVQSRQLKKPKVFFSPTPRDSHGAAKKKRI
jgi:hypothetical protein